VKEELKYPKGKSCPRCKRRSWCCHFGDYLKGGCPGHTGPASYMEGGSLFASRKRVIQDKR
jgi:hypothetical protein